MVKLTVIIDAFEFRDDRKLEPPFNFPKRISGTISRVKSNMVEATIGAFLLLCPAISMLTYLLRTHKIYHLPNNQQQGCMDSLLVTGQGRRRYDDRSMWEPEWSKLTKGKQRTVANRHECVY